VNRHLANWKIQNIGSAKMFVGVVDQEKMLVVLLIRRK